MYIPRERWDEILLHSRSALTCHYVFAWKGLYVLSTQHKIAHRIAPFRHALKDTFWYSKRDSNNVFAEQSAMSETWVNSWVPSACAWTSWQKNSKKGNRREQEGTRMGPGGIGMCRSNQNVWLSGSWVLHSLSQVKQFCHLVYFSSSEKPSEGWRWARILFPEEKNFYSVMLVLKNYLILYSRRN